MARVRCVPCCRHRSSADALPLSGTQHYLDAQTAEELRNYSLPEIVAAVRRWGQACLID